MSLSFVKFQQFVEDLGRKVHQLETDVIKVYLSNTAPNAAVHKVKADIAEIATGNGYAGGMDVSATYSQTGGVGTLTGTGQVVTASGGTVGPYRYAIVYNDTPTSPNKPLIGYWDYGSSITLNDGDVGNVYFNSAAGAQTILTIT